MLNKNEKMNKSKNSAPVVHLGEPSFDAEVLASPQPVLVAFWVPWSRPCQALSPVLQELANTLAGKVKVATVNADESLGLSLSYDIQSVPTLLCFVEGKPRLRIIGTATQRAILAALKPLSVKNETAPSANSRKR